MPYGHLLEATRATLARSRPIPRIARAILAVFSRRSLLSLAMFGGRVMRVRCGVELMADGDGVTRHPVPPSRPKLYFAITNFIRTLSIYGFNF